jgi:hypothetical protein
MNNYKKATKEESVLMNISAVVLLIVKIICRLIYVLISFVISKLLILQNKLTNKLKPHINKLENYCYRRARSLFNV